MSEIAAENDVAAFATRAVGAGVTPTMTNVTSGDRPARSVFGRFLRKANAKGMSVDEVSRPAPVFSIVICSIDEEKFRRVCDNYKRLFANAPIEIIGIHDAKSLSEGYNRGIAKASGEFLILSHDDIEILTPDFTQRLVAHLGRFDLIGVAGTTRLIGGAWFLAGKPYDFQLVASPLAGPGKHVIVVRGTGDLTIPSIQALDGLFMAMHMRVAKEIPFDEMTFDHFHLYDIDFSYRAYLTGYRLAVCRDLFIVHESGGTFDAAWEQHRARFEAKHAGTLAADFEVVDSPVLRIVVENKMLQDEQSIRWLCNPDNIASLIAKLDTLPGTPNT